MKENEKVLVGGLISLVAILVPGFLIHVSPRFPGSLEGGILGIAAAVLMLMTLLYPLCKRVSWLRRHVAMRLILLIHVFAGVIGGLAALLHTGHKMESPIGVAMIVLLLVTLISGFVGRYYMARVTADLRGQRETLSKLEGAYAGVAAELAASSPAASGELRDGVGLWPRWASFWLGHEPSVQQPADASQARRAVEVVEAIADTQYTISAQEALKRAFGLWMVVHIAATIGFFLLVGLHIWSSFYFGLRWLS